MRTTTPQQAERILGAASGLFASRHFHEVRMEDIAAEAGVGKGTLYRYFHTKDDLYIKLLERAADQYLVRLRQAATTGKGARERLVAVVAAVIAYFDDQPYILELLQRAEVDRGRGPGYPWLGVREEVFALVRGLLQEGIDHREFTVPDPELAMLLLMGGLRIVLRFGERPRPPCLAHQCIDAFIQAKK